MRSQSLSFLVTARCLAPLAGLALTLAAAPALAQDAPADDKAPALRVTNEALLDDFAHYVLIARPDLAESSAAQLLDRVTDAKDFANLVEEGDVNRFLDATTRAQKLQGNANLQALSGALIKLYDKGRLDRARDPKQIAENIAMLTGGQRAKLMGRQGLLQAGEYAMPQLLEAYLQDRDAGLSVEAQSVMIGLGRQSIVPLTTGLLAMTPTQQEKVVRVLGQVGYKMSVPALADLHNTTTSDQVRSACDRALQQLQSQPGDPAPLYRQLAEAYYSENSEVTNFPGEDFQLLWDFDPAVGLTMNAIRTPVFHEAMAMRLTERAMELEGANGSVNPDSLALWVASNYSREADTPEGYINPAYPVAGAAADGAEPRRSAEYFGVAVGGDVASRVLGRALNEKDTPLVRRSLAAVEQTAGGRVALSQAGASSPLVTALTYPNRRVQTEAALAVSAAAPTSDFSGSDRVVPILSSAVAAGTDQFAVVLSPDAERYQPMRAMLEKMGYKVLPAGQSLTELSTAIGEAPNVDLIIVTGFAAERSTQTIGEARGFTRTAATPMLVLTSPEVYAEQQRRFESDPAIALRPLGTGEDSLTKTIESLVDVAAGGRVSSEEAEAYAMRSLSALRDLAMAGNPVLKVSDAAGPLMNALPAAEGERRQGIATVLSLVGQDRAQRALFDAARASEGEDRAMLISQTTESAKRFGNMLEQRQVDELVVMAGSDDEAEATAAAALMGALNLPNRNLMPLILGKGTGMVGQR
jgi:HEAT repeat protein